MAVPLFAYGTLMYPLVICGVIGRVPKNRPGSVRGYRRLGVAGQSFPGLVSGGDEIIEGLLYEGLNEEEWRLLTAYEDSLYVLEKITLEDGTAALVYLVAEENHHLLTKDSWQPQRELMPD